MTEPGEDLVDEIVRERTASNPAFPAVVETALANRGSIGDDGEAHAVEIVEKGSGAARWKCSCGASTSGRWYRSAQEARKAADRHLERIARDAARTRAGRGSAD